MPVKVRCECGAGISAPDAARGKTIKCKKCGSPVRVPGGGKKAARRKRADPTPLDVHDEDFFSNIDMGRAEDRNVQVCPKCATEVDEDDIECPECGINLETGELSTKQSNLRKYKGPNPDDFYKISWSDSFDYLKKNLGIAISLCIFWSLFMTLYTATLFMVFYCEKTPLILFWSFVTVLCGAAPQGCFWQLWIETIKITMDGKDKLQRFRFEFFTDVVLGIKATVWPIALALPLVLLILWGVGMAVGFGGVSAIAGVSQALAISIPIVYLLPLMCYPVAMSHLASKYPFRAYLPAHMFRITFANFAPVAWWFLMGLALLLISLGAVVAMGFFWDEVYGQFGNGVLRLIELCGISIKEDDRGFMFSVTLIGIALPLLALMYLVKSVFLCIPMMMLVRANGLLARYNARTLELGFRVVANRPAGFWVRYLAFLIDACVIGAFYLLMILGFYGLNWCVAALEMAPETIERTKDSIYWGGIVGMIGIPFLYFLLEGGPTACTLGMRAIGLTVIQPGRKRMQSNAVVMRAFLRTLIIALSIALPPVAFAFAMCGMNSEKQALHDKITGTNVVWRGENV